MPSRLLCSWPRRTLSWKMEGALPPPCSPPSIWWLQQALALGSRNSHLTTPSKRHHPVFAPPARSQNTHSEKRLVVHPITPSPKKVTNIGLWFVANSRIRYGHLPPHPPGSTARPRGLVGSTPTPGCGDSGAPSQCRLGTWRSLRLSFLPPSLGLPGGGLYPASRPSTAALSVTEPAAEARRTFYFLFF